MKQIMREYLAQLREREELDAILPDLLSELGFHVYSRPQRGTAQHGVDIAAVGEDPDDGKRKLYLFPVKRGDLTRQDWDQGDQALRPSLNQIRDAYIPTKVPKKYAGLPIVICLVFGGSVREQIQLEVRNYVASNTTATISYEEWDGDKLAGLLMQGVLRERVLPPELQLSFRKAIALVDEPDVAHRHFSRLVLQMREKGHATSAGRIASARQLSICCWVMFVWGRSGGNIEAAYQAVELAMLQVWDLTRGLIGSRSAEIKALDAVFTQLVQLHLAITGEFIDRRVAPVLEARDVAATAVGGSALDINLALFDLLGRIAMAGHWLQWLSERNGAPEEDIAKRVDHYVGMGVKLVENNSALTLPISDEQTTAVALFLQLWANGSENRADVRPWLRAMARRYRHTLGMGRYYTTCKTSYRELLAHPIDQSDAYFQEATAGSTLITLLVLWLAAFREQGALDQIQDIAKRKLAHCTMQLWTVDDTSDQHLYRHDDQHGRALLNLPVDDPVAMIGMLEDVRTSHDALAKLSAVSIGLWPLVFDRVQTLAPARADRILQPLPRTSASGRSRRGWRSRCGCR